MILWLYFLWCYFIITHADSNENQKMPRYVVEEGVKPPIFGSYSYNPLTQAFETRDATNKTNIIQIQIFNKTVIHTNQLVTTEQAPNIIFRKHVTAATPKFLKTFKWWPLIARNRTISDDILRAITSSKVTKLVSPV